jgi:hypothetical protein
MNCDRARGDLDLLQDEGSRLKLALHGVKSRSELAEPSLWEVEFTWCRQARSLQGGTIRPKVRPFLTLHVSTICSPLLLHAFPPVEIHKMLVQARDAKVAADEVRATTIEKMHELLLAYENVVAAGCRADTLVLERNSELQKLHLVASMVCAHLSPPPSTEAPLIDRQRELPDHVERFVVEGICRGGCIALGQMVSHFDEIDAAIIAEGYSADRSDEELDIIEEQVRPFT